MDKNLKMRPRVDEKFEKPDLERKKFRKMLDNLRHSL